MDVSMGKRMIRWVVMLVVVIGLVAAAWYVASKAIKKIQTNPAGENLEVTGELKQKFGDAGLAMSDTSEKITLLPVNGMQGSGVATSEMAGDVFLHSILADLPAPATGKFYEGWLVRESDKDVIYTGKLTEGKGGWVLEYVGRVDLSDHKLVVVTVEVKDDQKPEAHVLEGKFK